MWKAVKADENADDLNKSKSMKKPDNKKSVVSFKKPLKSTMPNKKSKKVDGDRQYIFIQVAFLFKNLCVDFIF